MSNVSNAHVLSGPRRLHTQTDDAVHICESDSRAERAKSAVQRWRGKVGINSYESVQTHTHTHSSSGSLSPKYRAAGVRGLFIWGKKTAISRWWLTNGKSYKSQHVFPRLFPQGDFEPLLFWKRLSQVFCFSSPCRAAGTFVCILLFFSKRVVGGVEGQPVSQFFESHVSPPVE